jgi:hypothetical protein
MLTIVLIYNEILQFKRGRGPLKLGSFTLNPMKKIKYLSILIANEVG